MSMSTSSILQSSQQMFAILNQAQQTQFDQGQKIAGMNTESKLQNDKNALLGAVIDIVV